ncbi:MAG TPA: ACP S-malonyltransferase [Blastocatellia bacterium]|nr:ACP S-malonyltransferase [Blastocatellia bacterium]
MTVLVDHNVEGQAALLLSALATEGWLELGLFHLATFSDAGLPFDSSDRAVWQFIQDRKMLLLTGNRNMDGEDSLEQTIRSQNQPDSLPVVTIADINRIVEKPYREQCALRLTEIALYLDQYLGAGRLYIP